MKEYPLLELVTMMMGTMLIRLVTTFLIMMTMLLLMTMKRMRMICARSMPRPMFGGKYPTLRLPSQTPAFAYPQEGARVLQMIA
jgi:hypothetical protein